MNHYQPFQEEEQHHTKEIEIPNLRKKFVSRPNLISKEKEQSKEKENQEENIYSDSEKEYEEEEEEEQRVLYQEIKKKLKNKQKGRPESLQLRQLKLAYSNINAMQWAIRKRSCTRIFFLMMMMPLLVIAFYIIQNSFAFYEGMENIDENANIIMNISNCRLNIIDNFIDPKVITKDNEKNPNRDVSMLSKHRKQANLNDEILKESNTNHKQTQENKNIPNIQLSYFIPGRFNLDPRASISEVTQDKNGLDYTYTFKNILSAQNCEININVFQMTALNNLIINCTETCYMMISSTNVTFNNLNITGDLVEVNAPFLVSKNLSFQSIQGRFQGAYLDFQQFADIRLGSGDIIVQTDKEMMVNWTHSNPHYCYSSPVIANPVVVGCQQPPQSEIEAFLTGVGTGKNENTKVKKDSNQTDKGEKQQNSNETEETEYFYEESDATVIFLPFMDTYNKSKKFKENLGFSQEFEENQENNVTDTNHTKRENSTKKPNMHSKRKEKLEKYELLFQPSCFGNSIFCSTPNCTTIRDALSKNNESLSTDNTTTQSSNTTGRRYLTGNTLKQDTKTNETQTDYKGLKQEAYDSLPHIIPQGIRFLNLTGRFGNIYVNLISKPNSTVNQKDTIIHGISYTQENIEFDLPSQKQLKTYFEMASDPHVFDPNFVLEIGSKHTQSDNFQQWQVTYNPAYSYLKPWWIGTFSFTLMSTASWNLQLNLGHGYCPYMPNLNLNDIYRTNFLVEKYFSQAEHSIKTIAWQNSVIFPDSENIAESNGVRQVINSNDEFENWIQISKINETTYDLTIINLNGSLATYSALCVSILISVLMATILMVGVLYIINSVYKKIIDQVAQTSKYGSIQNTKDNGDDQPLMSNVPEVTSERDDNYNYVVDNSAGDLNEDSDDELEIILNFNPARLVYQLFVLAPPLSAFIEYFCILISKIYINSANQFYTHLFEQQGDSNNEQELHNLATESIAGNELKTLYEKFCFLNGFLEQKLDDEKNLKLLKQKGFEINLKQDIQSESYVRVLLTGIITKLPAIPQTRKPLALFIENCCKISNFEEDNIVVVTFNENFQQFCTLNHLEFEAPSAAELQKNYNIESKYIPQQWVERIPSKLINPQEVKNLSLYNKMHNCFKKCYKKCLPNKQIYLINRQKMENHYSLIMNQPEKIKTQSELELANNELILFRGWQIVDILTVLAHIITTTILIIPLFGFTYLEKILYAQYSLISEKYLITLEDVTANQWILPIKLYNESQWIKHILGLIVAYWIASLIDLIHYYSSMEFPQENYFKKATPQTSNMVQFFFRQGMWALVLFSAFQLCVFLTLSLVWLLLGAIVNPVAFLPYATAAATFITVISTKASQFREITTDGFETVIQYVENIAKGQMNNMLGNMNLKGKTNEIMNSDAFKSITEKAVSFGLIDQQTLNHLQENTETMLNNPEKALENVSEELTEISQDPEAFVANLTKQLEQKAESMIREQMAKQIDGFGEQLAEIMLALYKKDKYQFKNSMTLLISAAAKAQNLDSLMKMNQPIMNFIWEFAFPNDSNLKLAPQEYLDQLLGPCTDCITGLVAQEIQNFQKEHNEQYSSFNPKILQIIMRKSLSLAKNLQQDNLYGFFDDFEEIIQYLKNEPFFSQLSYLSRYSGLFRIALSLFEERKGGKLTFHRIFDIVSGFFDDIPQLKYLKDLLGMVELLVNSFKQQSKVLPAKSIRQRIEKGLCVLSKAAKYKGLTFSGKNKLLENASFISMLFNFIQHNFENIPKDQFKDIFKYAFEETNDCLEISKLVKSEKEYSKLIRLMTGIFEMVSIFMEDSNEIVVNQYLSAAAFSIDEKKAYYIQRVASLKYLKFFTYEGSEAEEDLFESLSANPLIINLTHHLRIDSHIIRGIIAQLIYLPNRYELQDLYFAIAKLNNSDVRRVRQFFQILTLFRSQNETHLFNAAVELSIPKEYFILILISKQILNYNYIDEESLIALGTQDETIKMQKNIDFDHKLWIQQLKRDIIQEDDGLVKGGNSIQLKLLLLETISDTNLQITTLKVQGILMALGNNANEFAKLSQKDIDLITNILALKNIDLINTHTLSSDTRQGIQSFAQILNINKICFEDLIKIVFLTNPEGVVYSIQNSQQSDIPFIKPNSIENYQNYVEFLYSKMQLIQNRYNFIIEKFNTLFPKFNLPQTLIIKLLLNKDYKMDMNSFYQLAYLILNINENGQLPPGVLKQLNKSVSFLTTTLNCSNIEQLRESLSNQDLTLGQGLIIQMLSESSQKRGLTLFLNYLFDNSKRSQNDQQRKLPQVYHLFSCLYLYFTGQASDIMIKSMDPISQQDKELSIIQFLSIKLDIKIEFFEALHTLYLQDNQQFTTVMVKFMRRYQACKYEQENPGIKIPLQSLVKIPDQFILNFINLIKGTGFQTSFFSKLLGLDPDVVMFISILMNIKNSQNANQRRIEFSYLNTNQQRLGQLLTKIQVKNEEFILLLNLIFQEYDINTLQQMIDGLKLQSKFKLSNLGAMLQLDQVINIDLNSKEYFDILAQLQENILIKQMKMDPGIIMMVKGLTRGGFGCLEQYVQILPHLDYTECPGKSEYFGLLQGLIGSISGVIPQNFNVRQSLSEMYKLLSNNDILNSAFQNRSNNIQYAYFQLVKTLQINPVILMLTQGILPAWKLLDKNYYIIQNQENKWINPILVLELILAFQALPTLIKEIFTEVEWFRQTSQIICEAQILKNKARVPYELVEFLDYSEFDSIVQLDKELKSQLFTEQLHSVESFQDLAQLIHFDKKIVDYVGLTTMEIHSAQSAILFDSVMLFGSEEPDYKQQCDSIAKFIKNTPPTDPEVLTISFEEAVDLAIQDPEQRIKIKSLKPQIRYRAMMKVYQETSKLFVDPRFEDQQKIPIFSEQYFMSKLPYEDIGVFSLGVCTTLNQLRTAYWKVGENVVPREDDHYKIVAGQVDYVLTSIDRLFHFKNCMDFFCKQRAATLIGLATGFAFTADHFIQANSTSSLVTYERANQLFKMMQTPYEIQKKKNQFKWKYLSSIMYNRNEYTKRDSKLFKVFDYKALKKYGLDIYTEPENYIEFAIQAQTQLDFYDKGYDWKQYFFDASYVPIGTSLDDLSRLQGQQTQYNGHLLSDRIMQLFLWMQSNSQYQINNLIQKAEVQQIQQSDLKSKIYTYSSNQQSGPNIDFETIYDVRSGRKWSEVLTSQEKWSMMCYQQTDNFRLLIDILKGNYQSICEPDTYFTDQEPQAALAYSGLIALSGSFYKIKYGWAQNTSADLSRYLNNCCQNISSNKKNLQELLSIYFGCFEGLNALSQIMFQDSLLVNSLVTLSCQLSNNEQNKYDHLGNLINTMDLSVNDSAVLKGLIRAYLGEVDQYYQLAQFSKLITPPTVNQQRFNPVQIRKLIKNTRKNRQDKPSTGASLQQIQQQNSNEIGNQSPSEIESQFKTQTSENNISFQEIQQQHSLPKIASKQQYHSDDQILSTVQQRQTVQTQYINQEQSRVEYLNQSFQQQPQDQQQYQPYQQQQQQQQQQYQSQQYQPYYNNVLSHSIQEQQELMENQKHVNPFPQQQVIYVPVIRIVDNNEIVEYVPKLQIEQQQSQQSQQQSSHSFQQDSPQVQQQQGYLNSSFANQHQFEGQDINQQEQILRNNDQNHQYSPYIPKQEEKVNSFEAQYQSLNVEQNLQIYQNELGYMEQQHVIKMQQFDELKIRFNAELMGIKDFLNIQIQNLKKQYQELEEATKNQIEQMKIELQVQAENIQIKEKQFQEEQQNLNDQQKKTDLEILHSLKQQFSIASEQYIEKEQQYQENQTKLGQDILFQIYNKQEELNQTELLYQGKQDYINDQIYENDYEFRNNRAKYMQLQENVLQVQMDQEKIYLQDKEALNFHMIQLQEQLEICRVTLRDEIENLEKEFNQQKESLNIEFRKQEEQYFKEQKSQMETLDRKVQLFQKEEQNLNDQQKKERHLEINSLQEQLNTLAQDYQTKLKQFEEDNKQAEYDFSLKEQWFQEQMHSKIQQFKNEISLIQKSQEHNEFALIEKLKYYREQILEAVNQQYETQTKSRQHPEQQKFGKKEKTCGASSVSPVGVSPVKYRKGNIKQAFKVKNNKYFMESSNTGDMYYSVPKILNKLLYGLDQSQLHKLDKIDPNRFNFFKYSALSLDQNQTENQFIILLWQLAQAATKTTLPDNCKLPIVTESELSSDNKNSKEFKTNYEYIWPRCEFMIQVMNDDFSFFFKDAEVSQTILADFQILRKDQQNGDLNFLKAMIGLKSNKMQIIQNKVRKSQGSKNKPVDISGLDLQEQINNLYNSKIIHIQIENQTEEFNEKISKSIAQLFLALSSGNINQIVQSLMERDSMNASFILSLFLWKNITPILSKPNLIQNLETQKMILPAIQFLPLLIFSQIIDQQDKSQAMPNLIDIKLIINSMQRIIKILRENKVSQQLYEELEQIQQIKIKDQQQFQWSIWIIYIPQFLAIFRQFAQKEKLNAYGPSEYIFKLITGFYFFEKIQQTKFIGSLMQLYVQCNKLINYPDSLKNQTINLKKLIPPTMVSLMDFLPEELKTYVQIFDKFLQLFIFIQIPSKSMKLLKQYSQNQTINPTNRHKQLKTIIESNEDTTKTQVEESFLPQQENEQTEVDSTNAEIQQIIIEFILDILGQTFNGLCNSFKEETKKELTLKIREITIEINDIKVQNNEVEMQNYQVEELASMEQQLNYFQYQSQQLDEQTNFIKKTVKGIIILLTGYDINDRSTIATQELKQAILCYILDQTLFCNLGLLEYINTSVIRDLYYDILDITNQPFKSINNLEFVKSIMQLIYTVTGQELSSQFKLRKSKLSVHKSQDMSSSIRQKWYIILPERKPIVELPMNTIMNIFYIATGRIEGISLLLRDLKVGEGVIRIVDNLINQVNDIGVFQGKPIIAGQSQKISKKSQEIQELMNKVKEGTATYEDIFKAIDEDGTNSISKQEFGILSKRLGMNLSEHRINEIFASIKKTSAKDDTLNQVEFAKATTYLQQKNTLMALDFLGISPELLTLSLIILAIILLLIFIFIFLGIQAFALGGTFGAIINSLLPMVAGSGAGSKTEKLGDKGKRDTSISDSVEKTQKIIQSDQI